MIEKLQYHSDFLSTSSIMNILNSGTEDVIKETVVTISSSASYSISAASFLNQTVSYIFDVASGSEVNYQLLDEAFIIYENSFNQFTPILTWSSAGSVSILHNLERYNNASVPSWITINSNTGIIDIASPLVNRENYPLP